VICFLASLLRWLTFTNLDREPEWARYSGTPAGSHSEGQSPLAQGMSANLNLFRCLRARPFATWERAFAWCFCCIH